MAIKRAFVKSQGRWKKTENPKIWRSNTEGVTKQSVHHQRNSFCFLCTLSLSPESIRKPSGKRLIRNTREEINKNNTNVSQN